MTVDPAIIQGGMGVGVSDWQLSGAVARAGGLGVVSGTALDALLVRRLQIGDRGGDVREALAAFPFRDVAERILVRYFRAGGLAPGQAFRPLPRLGLRPNPVRDQLVAAANFVEIFLAKRGHHGLVGINYLEKIQLATPAAVYGAMLADVDYVLMGAGVPAEIPQLLESLAAGKAGEIGVTVDGAPAGAAFSVRLDPRAVFGAAPVLRRPQFLAIVSSHVLVAYLARDERTRPDGVVIETPIAGGHSARPRGPAQLDDEGQPVYGPRDEPDLAKLRAVGSPFWLAGGYASPDKLRDAQAAGAVGIQVGSAFALCRESGIPIEVRKALLAEARAGRLVVHNDPAASPTGFPFKVAALAGTLAIEAVYSARERICDLGYLRTPYLTHEGKVGYRCPSEPVEAYVAKGGAREATVGRRCVCNGLTATVGLAQTRPNGYVEPALVTLGQDLDFLRALPFRGDDYTASDVVRYLTGFDQDAPAPASE
jgi:NAD(P)H-dependent flavin oxidoreductase YrpB (nitropropane dioxygenase family)